MTATVPQSIAFVMPSFDPGGTERQMIELIRRLDRRRWHVHVACFHRSGAWLPRVDDVAHIVEFPVRSFRRTDTLGLMKAFARWCRALDIAVVHTTHLPSNIFGLPAAAVAGVPVRIGNRRELNPDKSAAELTAQRAAYLCAHRVVANCQAAADRLTHVEGVPSQKVMVIPNGIALDSQPISERARLARRAIVVANLRAEKGHDVLLRAAAILIKQFPDATFEFVGDGPERPALESLSRQLGLGEHVSFLGHREDVSERLAQADLCVLPSRSEAFPNALLEAMAAGLPVVASGVGGVLELVRDGETGLIVPADDHLALSAAIRHVMLDPQLAESLGRAARSWVSARYSFDRMTAAFEDMYVRQLERAGRFLSAAS